MNRSSEGSGSGGVSSIEQSAAIGGGQSIAPPTSTSSHDRKASSTGALSSMLASMASAPFTAPPGMAHLAGTPMGWGHQYQNLPPPQPQSMPTTGPLSPPQQQQQAQSRLLSHSPLPPPRFISQLDPDRILLFLIIDYLKRRSLMSSAQQLIGECRIDPLSTETAEIVQTIDYITNAHGQSPQPSSAPDGGFLSDWWGTFWALFQTRMSSPRPRSGGSITPLSSSNGINVSASQPSSSRPEEQAIQGQPPPIQIQIQGPNQQYQQQQQQQNLINARRALLIKVLQSLGLAGRELKSLTPEEQRMVNLAFQQHSANLSLSLSLANTNVAPKSPVMPNVSNGTLSMEGNNPTSLNSNQNQTQTGKKKMRAQTDGLPMVPPSPFGQLTPQQILHLRQLQLVHQHQLLMQQMASSTAPSPTTTGSTNPLVNPAGAISGTSNQLFSPTITGQGNRLIMPVGQSSSVSTTTGRNPAEIQQQLLLMQSQAETKVGTTTARSKPTIQRKTEFNQTAALHLRTAPNQAPSVSQQMSSSLSPTRTPSKNSPIMSSQQHSVAEVIDDTTLLSYFGNPADWFASPSPNNNAPTMGGAEGIQQGNPIPLYEWPIPTESTTGMVDNLSMMDMMASSAGSEMPTPTRGVTSSKRPKHQKMMDTGALNIISPSENSSLQMDQQGHRPDPYQQHESSAESSTASPLRSPSLLSPTYSSTNPPPPSPNERVLMAGSPSFKFPQPLLATPDPNDLLLVHDTADESLHTRQMGTESGYRLNFLSELGSHLRGSKAVSASFSHDGALLVSGGHDKRLLVFSAQDRTLLFALEGHHSQQITQVRFSPGGPRRLLATASFDKTIHIWDLGLVEESHGTGRFTTISNTPLPTHPIMILREAHDEPVWSIDFVPNGSEAPNRLCSIDASGKLVVWDLLSGAILHSRLIKAADDQAVTVRQIKVSSNGARHIHDSVLGMEEDDGDATSPTSPPSSISKKHTPILAIANGMVVELLELEGYTWVGSLLSTTGNPQVGDQKAKPIVALNWGDPAIPHHLITSTSETVTIWNVAPLLTDGTQALALATHHVPADKITCCTLIRDLAVVLYAQSSTGGDTVKCQKRFAIFGGYQSVYLWEYEADGVATASTSVLPMEERRRNRMPIKFDAHSGLVVSLAMTRSGPLLIGSASHDGSIGLWELGRLDSTSAILNDNHDESGHGNDHVPLSLNIEYNEHRPVEDVQEPSILTI